MQKEKYDIGFYYIYIYIEKDALARESALCVAGALIG
jgi:hypothetical protein